MTAPAGHTDLFVRVEPMMEVLMEPGEEDVGADIAEDDESECLCNASEEGVDIVESVAGSAIVAVDMREILMAARSAADISEFFLVAGGAESSLTPLCKEARLFVGGPFAPGVASVIRFFKHLAAGEADLIVNAGCGGAGFVAEGSDASAVNYDVAAGASQVLLAVGHTGRFKHGGPNARGVAEGRDGFGIDNALAVGAGLYLFAVTLAVGLADNYPCAELMCVRFNNLRLAEQSAAKRAGLLLKAGLGAGAVLGYLPLAGDMFFFLDPLGLEDGAADGAYIFFPAVFNAGSFFDGLPIRSVAVSGYHFAVQQLAAY